MGPIGPMGLIGYENISPIRLRSLGLHNARTIALLALALLLLTAYQSPR
jgi:hypothetical protein